MTLFAKLNPDSTLIEQRVIRQSDLLKCPHVILVPEHYRPDGTCYCNEPNALNMRVWGYKWDKKSNRWI